MKADVFYHEQNNQLVIIHSDDTGLSPIVMLEFVGWFQSRFKFELSTKLIHLGEL